MSSVTTQPANITVSVSGRPAAHYAGFEYKVSSKHNRPLLRDYFTNKITAGKGPLNLV